MGGGLFIFGGILLKRSSSMWWGFAVKLGLLPFHQWILIVLPQLTFLTFMVLNLLKFPILLLMRQSQILFDFMCINTILRSRNMVLLRADYSYYFWSNILVMFLVLWVCVKNGILHLLGLPGGLLFFPKIQVLLSLSGWGFLLFLSLFQVLYFIISKWWRNTLISAKKVLAYFGLPVMLI